jgi:hypothetical protein
MTATPRPSHIDLNFRPAWPKKTTSNVEEVAMASIAIESTLAEVTSVLARPYKGKIYYRVVDDNGFVYGAQITRRSNSPLTLGALIRYFQGAWDLLEVLEGNFAHSGYPPDQVRRFFKAESNFYPKFAELINQRVEKWLNNNKQRWRLGGKSPSNLTAPNSSTTSQNTATAPKETAREFALRELSTNPKWKESKDPGRVTAIIGAKR